MPDEEDESLGIFTDILRKAIATTPDSDSEPVWFSFRGRGYGFARLNDKPDFYAGFEVNMAAFKKKLVNLLERSAGKEMLLVATGEGIEAGTDSIAGSEDIVVIDSFSASSDNENKRSVFKEELQNMMADERPLAWGRLHKPMDSIRIMAFLKSPEKAVNAIRLRNRLYLWGILLLGGGIIAGVWLVFAIIAEEMKRVISRQDFLMGISHDLRTPLASMKVLAESLLLDRVKDSDKRRKFLEIIVSECDRLNMMSERILYLVRYGQDAITLKKSSMNGLEIIKKAAADFEKIVMAAGKNINTKIVLNDMVKSDVFIIADENAISQVVMNLLDNAFKYGKPSDGSRAIINITIENILRRAPFSLAIRNWLKLSVADNGMGMNWYIRRKIFRRFFRAAEAREKGVAGSGLGLSLCQYIVKEHGGWIEAKRGKDGGTVFNVYLPAS